jgi:metal-responsive CopG/Arc/MetJ family transcriptional regulator
MGAEAMERINVRVDHKLKRELEAEARAKGVSPSDIVRQALREHLERREPRETCLDIARRIGIVGIYKDTPPDLSTNPAHMEGFGGG